MRALCWHGKKKVQVDTVPDPKILNPRDAIVRITSTAICGSDLHLYNGVMVELSEKFGLEVGMNVNISGTGFDQFFSNVPVWLSPFVGGVLFL
jgi:threonine dehydrogenase-like Zn-dependent dehydrogenase